MPSIDIAINASTATSSSSAPQSQSPSASTSPSTQASPTSGSSPKPSSQSGQSTTHGNNKSNDNAASSAKSGARSSDKSNASKDTKQSDAVASTTANSKDAAAVSTTAVDTSKDFLTTLAALLDEGATIEAPPIEKPVNIDAMVDAQKGDEPPTDTQAAVIDAMLFGAPLVPTAASVVASTPTTTKTSSDRSASLDATGVATNVSRSLAAVPALSSNAAETDALSTAVIPPGMTANALETFTESLEETTASIDSNASDNTPLSIASENRVASGREVREQGSLDARVGTAKWTDELAARVSLLSQRDIHVASLRLSPEHLGPLEIQITVQNDKTSVWFGAAHAETRAALEQALPRLRELLSSQGLTLTDSGVFREPPRDQMRGYQNPNGSLLGDGSDATRAEVDVRVKVNRSLLDAYA
jgi:flagellar hook-length control protein FliK